MLILSDKVDNIYSILDTDDMTVENIEKKELLNVIENGVFIYGLSKFSLECDIDITLILRLYGKNDVKDFDGLILRDYCSNYDDIRTHVIDWRLESNTLILDQVFNEVVDIIRRNNKIETEIDTDLPVGYEIYAYGDDLVTLKELSTGSMYSCDFYTCLYIYTDEKQSIKGVDEISYDHMICNGNYYSSDKVLKSYKNSSISSNVKKVLRKSSVICDDFRANWGSIDSDLGVNDFIPVTECGFPIYNIKRCINRINCNLADIDFSTLLSTACSIENGRLYFDNNNYISGAHNIARYINVINFKSENLKNEAICYIEAVKAKEVLLKKDTGITRNLTLSREVYPNDICTVSCNSYNIADFRHKDIINLKTKFGLICSVQSAIINSDNSFSNMFLTRITNCGSCWYSAKIGKIEIGTMSSCWKGNCLCNDIFVESCWSCIKSGLSYHDVLIPLGLSSVDIDEYAIDVKILCMILPDEDCSLLHSINIVEVPLLFCGAKFDEFDDCFRLMGMFQTLYLEKSVVYNLYGNFDEDSFMNIWSNLSLKKSKEIYNSLYNHSKVLLSHISENRI